MTKIHLKTCAAPAAMLALALCVGLPAIAAAQDYDGYCYAKKDQASTNGAVAGALVGGAIGGATSGHRSKGTGTVAGAVVGGLIGSQIGKSSVKCYNGSYYSYQGRYYTPPAAPDGYQTLYFRQRPASGYYEHVYTTPPSPDDQYADQDNGQNGYNQQNGDDQYAPPPPPPPSGQGYNHYGDNAQNGQYSSSSHYSSGQTGAGQQYSNNSYQPGDTYSDGSHNGGMSPQYAVSGWEDDQGTWHDGRPRAVGWQDDNGQWHVGEIQAYGWRDSRGNWHEEQPSDDQGQADDQQGGDQQGGGYQQQPSPGSYGN